MIWSKKKEESLNDIRKYIKQQTELIDRAVDYLNGGYGAGKFEISKEGQARIEDLSTKGKKSIKIKIHITRIKNDWYKISYILTDDTVLGTVTSKMLINDRIAFSGEFELPITKGAYHE